MNPVEHRAPVNDIELCWFEWNAAAPGPVLLFAHATGFHARAFDAVIEHFPDRRVLSLDLRGHGRSGGGPIEDWREVGADIVALADRLDLNGLIGVGHSMGAHNLLQCSADRPDLFARTILFDPVILAPEFYEGENFGFDPDEQHPTAKRKNDFDSPEAMFERFHDRMPYKLFDPRVLRDYCDYGLLPKADGEGFELACAPETEASVYMSSRSNTGIIDAAKTVETPTLVVRAKRSEKHDFLGSPVWPQLAAIIPGGEDMHRPDMTHFHPFQDPADAACIVREFAGL